MNSEFHDYPNENGKTPKNVYKDQLDIYKEDYETKNQNKSKKPEFFESLNEKYPASYPTLDPEKEQIRLKKELYKKELQEQMKRDQIRKLESKFKEKLTEIKLISEHQINDWFGREGIGAPARDKQGNVITSKSQPNDPNQMSYNWLATNYQKYGENNKKSFNFAGDKIHVEAVVKNSETLQNPNEIENKSTINKDQNSLNYQQELKFPLYHNQLNSIDYMNSLKKREREHVLRSTLLQQIEEKKRRKELEKLNDMRYGNEDERRLVEEQKEMEKRVMKDYLNQDLESRNLHRSGMNANEMFKIIQNKGKSHSGSKFRNNSNSSYNSRNNEGSQDNSSRFKGNNVYQSQDVGGNGNNLIQQRELAMKSLNNQELKGAMAYGADRYDQSGYPKGYEMYNGEQQYGNQNYDSRQNYHSTNINTFQGGQGGYEGGTYGQLQPRDYNSQFTTGITKKTKKSKSKTRKGKSKKNKKHKKSKRRHSSSSSPSSDSRKKSKKNKTKITGLSTNIEFKEGSSKKDYKYGNHNLHEDNQYNEDNLAISQQIGATSTSDKQNSLEIRDRYDDFYGGWRPDGVPRRRRPADDNSKGGNRRYDGTADSNIHIKSQFIQNTSKRPRTPIEEIERDKLRMEQEKKYLETQEKIMNDLPVQVQRSVQLNMDVELQKLKNEIGFYQNSLGEQVMGLKTDILDAHEQRYLVEDEIRKLQRELQNAQAIDEIRQRELYEALGKQNPAPQFYNTSGHLVYETPDDELELLKRRKDLEVAKEISSGNDYKKYKVTNSHTKTIFGENINFGQPNFGNFDHNSIEQIYFQNNKRLDVLKEADKLKYVHELNSGYLKEGADYLRAKEELYIGNNKQASKIE